MNTDIDPTVQAKVEEGYYRLLEHRGADALVAAAATQRILRRRVDTKLTYWASLVAAAIGVPRGKSVLIEECERILLGRATEARVTAEDRLQGSRKQERREGIG